MANKKSDQGFTALGYILWGVEISTEIFKKLRADGCPMSHELEKKNGQIEDTSFMEGYILEKDGKLIYYPSYKEAFALVKTGIPIALAG